MFLKYVMYIAPIAFNLSLKQTTVNYCQAQPL